ncbi:hypothetical protein [Dasania marina]|uniref:hypothetical protein n=1 Tax=Dasania marina TaxID=471499 RepID=UPI000364AB58|nr:hypothetical protein [Dasania marina]
MKLWIGGELDHSVAEEFRIASIHTEDYINEKISGIDTGQANEWDVIAIIRDDNNFDERVRFNKKDGMDIRLNISYSKFRSSSRGEQIIFLLEMLIRSLDIIINKYPEIADLAKVRSILREAKSNA